MLLASTREVVGSEGEMRQIDDQGWKREGRREKGKDTVANKRAGEGKGSGWASAEPEQEEKIPESHDTTVLSGG